MKLIFGTTSKRKTEDLQNIIDEMNLDIEVVSMEDIGWDRGEIEEDGSVCLKFCSNQKQQIMSWVMSFGPAVEVLKPESLRKAVRINAEKVLEKYKV